MPFLAIEDNTFPFVVLSTLGEVVPWGVGNLMQIISKSNYLRITSMGVQHSRSNLISLGANAWNSTQCVPVKDALCEESSSSRMQFFNTKSVTIPDNWDLLPSNTYLNQFPGNSACIKHTSERQIKIDDKQYEVSLCDLMDSNLDIIYELQSNTIWWRKDETSALEYIIIGFIGVYLISSLANNFTKVMEPFGKTEQDALEFMQKWKSMNKFEQKNTEIPENLKPYLHRDEDSNDIVPVMRSPRVFSALLFVMMLVVVGLVLNSWNYIVSDLDRSLAVWLISFVLIDSFIVMFHSDVYVSYNISLLTCLVLLLSCRIHHTFDTPYLTLFCLFFGSRSFFKLIAWSSGISGSNHLRNDVNPSEYTLMKGVSVEPISFRNIENNQKEKSDKGPLVKQTVMEFVDLVSSHVARFFITNDRSASFLLILFDQIVFYQILTSGLQMANNKNFEITIAQATIIFISLLSGSISYIYHRDDLQSLAISMP